MLFVVNKLGYVVPIFQPKMNIVSNESTSELKPFSTLFWVRNVLTIQKEENQFAETVNC